MNFGFMTTLLRRMLLQVEELLIYLLVEEARIKIH